MKKILPFFVLLFALSSCFGGEDDSGIVYLDEPLSSDFETVIKAHHASLADRLDDYMDDVRGAGKTESDTDTKIAINGKGVSIDLSFAGTVKQDVSEDHQKMESSMDYTFSVDGDTPIFPTKINVEGSGGMDTFVDDELMYFQLSNTQLDMGDLADIASQLLAMAKLIEDKWILLDPEEASAITPTNTSLSQQLPSLMNEVSDYLRQNALLKHVSDVESEDEDYYVYEVSFDVEAITGLLELFGLQPADIDLGSLEDVSAWFSVHKMAPSLWSFDIVEGQAGSMRIGESIKGFEFMFSDTEEGVSLLLEVGRGVQKDGRFEVSSEGSMVVDGEFSYTYQDLSGAFDGLFYIHGLPNLEKPLEVSIVSTADGVANPNLSLEAPEDAISAKDLGLGFAGNSSDINIDAIEPAEDIDEESSDPNAGIDPVNG